MSWKGKIHESAFEIFPSSVAARSLGHIIGAPNVLSYSQDVYKYLRALAQASPRVKVFTVGKTEEGREWVVASVPDETTIKNLDRYKEMNAKLADPRRISESEAASLIKQAKPMYWATGGMHSGETGSVEMLMELAYHLAADDAPFIKTIRDNLIVMITPIIEVDDRAKYVDLAMAPRKDLKASVPRSPLWWGKYVGHDDNRDNIGCLTSAKFEQGLISPKLWFPITKPS